MSNAADVYEKLGAFYLGRHDDDEGEGAERPLLYDSRDLLTHAVCVGMTGSGKTGLCIGLLEEAAIDGVPALVVDPKGDLGNLMLTFPDLAPSDFEPWVSADDARRKGLELDEYAQSEAEKWKSGLASWGQDAARIAKLRESADFAIYTPGSDAGLPLSIIKSFDPPGDAVGGDADLLAERVTTTVTSLLGLIGVDADPVQSRENILLSKILADEWAIGRGVDLAGLIHAVQDPGFDTVGVLELETFYPKKDRFKLSMQINNLVASPGFASWSRGEPLDVDRLLYTPKGKPRIAILSIAHLSEEERMFFVALLFNEVLGWMRAQSGSRNLRALLYMDEIYGYIPPVANPPSKKPLLTLMKQARAFGLGVVLATQNPVDLDYKALSNAGTWFIGRLQTAQDKARLIDALDGASATAGQSFDRQEAERIISGLGKRVFLLHNVHEPAPVVFQTRWVMSYLRGPLVRDEIKTLMGPRKEANAQSVSEPLPATPGPLPEEQIVAPAASDASEHARPTLPAGVAEYFMPIDPTLVAEGASLNYRPAVLATARAGFNHAKSGLVTERPVSRLATFTDSDTLTDWSSSIRTTLDPSALKQEPESVERYSSLPSIGTRKTSYTTWKRAFSDFVYRTESHPVLYAPDLDAYARSGEDERAFRIRLGSIARERRDEIADKLLDRYAARVRRVEERLSTAEARVKREKAQARRAKVDAGTRVGVAIFDAIFGSRRSAVRGTASSMRAGARAREQGADVDEAKQKLDELEQERDRLQAELTAEIDALGSRLDASTVELKRIDVSPRRSDVSDVRAVLVWLPVAHTPDGRASLAFRLDPEK